MDLYCELMIAGAVSMLILGIGTLFTQIPDKEEYQRLILVKYYFTAILLTLSVGLFACYFTGYDEILDKISTLCVAPIQAIFFTSFMKVLMFPMRDIKLFAAINVALILLIDVALYVVYFTHLSLAMPVIYVGSAIYVVLCIYYSIGLLKDYKNFIMNVEAYYDEELEYKSRWLIWLFYGYIIIGTMALLTIFLGVSFYILFVPTFIVFYFFMTIKFSTYIQSMSYIFPVMKSNREKESVAQTICIDKALNSNIAIVEMIRKWIEDKGYLMEAVSAESLSTQWGIDVNDLRETIKEQYGEDFRTLRIRMRIEFAKEMIDKRPDISLSAVREACGIEDRSNFHKHFIRFVGVSPTEYKQSKK